ncbi:hypothetical protein COCMIDRAFT_9896 [Bipolaris oryzae ATCC 44560]|uniref:Uncharacterized protein n=1 Tax=Bipolaris oryzae ATCC 44560 TaxID=930090 RepID=W6YRT5_COCMI|nr:uncharacterized protein COCMIDRAFT_9896 [Bipolaris oryzae ATCC 44560]EUC40188.1 hypothetical protein COCMIDRAFT_9896 [Bipolaris oryzae ATCC 44560]
MSAENSALTSPSSVSSTSRRHSIFSVSSTADRDKPLLAGAPTSYRFEIRPTPHAGRAVFAVQDMLKNALLWRLDDPTFGILWRYHNSYDWEKLLALALASDSTPYHNADDLSAFTRTYLHLLAILPPLLLPLVTAEIEDATIRIQVDP